MLRRTLIGLALAVASFPLAATTITTYTDRALWTAASTGVTTIDFETLGASPGAATGYSTAAGVTLSGVNFVGILPGDYYLFAEKENPGSSLYWGSGTVLMGPWYQNLSGRYIQINLPAHVTAFGLDLMANSMTAQQVTIVLPGVNSFLVNTQANPTRTFWGFTSDTPISTIQISATASPLIDNVSFGTAAPAQTPEIATFILIGTGLLGLRWLRRRQTNPGRWRIRLEAQKPIAWNRSTVPARRLPIQTNFLSGSTEVIGQ